MRLLFLELSSLVLDHFLEALHIANLVLVYLHYVLVLDVQLGQFLVKLIQVLLVAAVHRVYLILMNSLNVLDFILN